MLKTEFTVKELAVLVGVDERIPSLWISKGKLKATRSGPKWIISRDEAMRVVTERKLEWYKRFPLLPNPDQLT